MITIVLLFAVLLIAGVAMLVYTSNKKKAKGDQALPPAAVETPPPARATGRGDD